MAATQKSLGLPDIWSFEQDSSCGRVAPRAVGRRPIAHRRFPRALRATLLAAYIVVGTFGRIGEHPSIDRPAGRAIPGKSY